MKIPDFGNFGLKNENKRKWKMLYLKSALEFVLSRTFVKEYKRLYLRVKMTYLGIFELKI